MFQAGNVHDSASLFNLKEKNMSGRFWTYDLENLTYHANHQIIADGG